MIFVGCGSYLRNAINTVISKGYSVDFVFAPDSEPEKFLYRLNIPFKVANINDKESIDIIKMGYLLLSSSVTPYITEYWTGL